MTIDVAQNTIINDITQNIINIATIQKAKPINFLNEKQFEYTHAKFLQECSGPFLSFFSKLLDNVRKVANSSINKNNANPTTNHEKEQTLAYILATIFKFLLRNGFHWDHTIMEAILIFLKSQSDLISDIFAAVTPGCLGGVRVSTFFFLIVLEHHFFYSSFM
jgi:hypothetical protein